MVIAELITRATDITFHDTTLPQDSVDYININRAVLTQRLKNNKQLLFHHKDVGGSGSPNDMNVLPKYRVSQKKVDFRNFH